MRESTGSGRNLRERLLWNGGIQNKILLQSDSNNSIIENMKHVSNKISEYKEEPVETC